MTWFGTNLNRRDWDSLAWEWEKARIMEAFGGQDMSELSLACEISINTSMQKTTVNSTHEHTFSSSLSHHELLYVKDAAIYNSEVSSGEIRPELQLDSMAQLFSEDTDLEVCTLWDMIRAMSGVTKYRPISEVVSGARKFLETSHLKFIRY